MSTKKTTTIHQALIAAQREMGPLLKNAENPHFRNAYADINSVLGTIIEPLLNNGLIVMQTVEMNEQGIPLLRTTLVHESGETIDGGLYPLYTKDDTDPQKLASANTYARRYALMSMFAIGAEDDDGNNAAGMSGSTSKPKTKSASTGKPASAKQKDYAKSMLKQAGYSNASAMERRVKEVTKKSFDELTSSDASKLIDALKKEIDTPAETDPNTPPF